MIKRALDVTVAAVALVLLSPLLAVLAAAVWWEDGGPVLYRQIRAGLDGRPFMLWKLRTMTVGADRLHPRVLLFKNPSDARVTRVGRWLRRASLDELPQLWNVLKGDMSLVGPRPMLFFETFPRTLQQQARLRVRPGLTGLRQVSGRSDLTPQAALALDCRYVVRRSLAFDLWLLARTVPAVLTGRGAY